MSGRSTIAASPTARRATTTARSRTSIRILARSAERRRVQQPRHRLSQQGQPTTAPSRTSIKRSRSTRTTRSRFYNRGTAYYDKLDHDRAIESFEEAIKLNAGLCAGAARPRRRLLRQARLRPRHRRLRAALTERQLCGAPQSRRRRRSTGCAVTTVRLRRRRPPAGQAQPERSPGVQRSRRRVRCQGRARSRHRRLQPGDQDQPRLTAPASTIAATPTTASASSTAPSPTSTRRSSSNPRMRSRTTIAA